MGKYSVKIIVIIVIKMWYIGSSHVDVLFRKDAITMIFHTRILALSEWMYPLLYALKKQNRRIFFTALLHVNHSQLDKTRFFVAAIDIVHMTIELIVNCNSYTLICFRVFSRK